MLKNLVRKIFSGYYQKGKSLLLLLVVLAAALVLSLAIVYPLWYFATSNPRAYTYFCLILAGAGTLFFLVRKSLRRRKQEILPENRSLRIKRQKAFWASLGKVVLSLVCLYILFLQFQGGSILTGTLLAVVFFFFLGWLFFGGPGEKKNEQH